MKNSTKLYLTWHKRLMWVAAATLLFWGISGALHPIMSWTGPKAKRFFPPQLETKVDELRGFESALAAASREPMATTKILPSTSGPVLQVTRSKLQPRLYFDLQTGDLLQNHDRNHALWLANYYVGKNASKVKSVDFITEFSSEYPWVNRLLPVYRIEFADDEGHVAFIHTETNRLASLTNDWRSSLQVIFRALHTWNWFDDATIARVLVIALMMLSLVTMAFLGIGLIFGLPNRNIPNKSRFWHRKLGHFMWLPVLAWSISGFYHLLQAELVTSVAGLKLDKPFQIPADAASQNSANFDLEWLSDYYDRPINGISLVRGQNSQLLFRVSVGPKDSQQQLTNQQRFKGRPTEVESFYVNAISGTRAEQTSDKSRAVWLAQEHLNVEPQDILDQQIVTRFGNGYDFRNKRLPVWKVSINDSDSTHLFIDPTTGILVDKNRAIDRAESWSFSFLHKWNMLNPLTGRFARDIVIVSILGLGILFVLIGILSKVKIKRRQKEPVG